jgi:hypothetical protein
MQSESGFKRYLNPGIGAAGIVFLLLAVFTNHWVEGHKSLFLDVPVDKALVGLRGITVCDDLACESQSHAEVAKSVEEMKQYLPKEEWRASEMFTDYGKFNIVAAATFWLALATSAIMLLCVVLALRDRRPQWPISPFSVALVLDFALIVCVALTLALHPFKTSGWGASYSYALATLGTLGILYSSLMLGKTRPEDVEWWD